MTHERNGAHAATLGPPVADVNCSSWRLFWPGVSRSDRPWVKLDQLDNWEMCCRQRADHSPFHGIQRRICFRYDWTITITSSYHMSLLSLTGMSHLLRRFDGPVKHVFSLTRTFFLLSSGYCLSAGPASPDDSGTALAFFIPEGYDHALD